LNTIWKYEIPEDERCFEIRMPKGSKFLSLQMQKNKPVMWYLVNTKNKNVKKRFLANRTGCKVLNKETWKYLDTFQLRDGDCVKHLYEEG